MKVEAVLLLRRSGLPYQVSSIFVFGTTSIWLPMRLLFINCVGPIISGNCLPLFSINLNSFYFLWYSTPNSWLEESFHILVNLVQSSSPVIIVVDILALGGRSHKQLLLSSIVCNSSSASSSNWWQKTTPRVRPSYSTTLFILVAAFVRYFLF